MAELNLDFSRSSANGLLPAMQKISAWIVQQGQIAKDAAKGENVIPMRA